MASSDTLTSTGRHGGPETLSQVETFAYDEKIVRMFVLATIVWGFVGMLVAVAVTLFRPSRCC